MALKFVEKIVSKENITFLFEGSINELEKNVNDFFLMRKYKLKKGTTLRNAAYEKGNYTLRILFGVFVKYFKFNVFIKPVADDKLKLILVKGHSGFSGGLIGMSQLKKEYNFIADSLQNIDSALGIYAQ